MIIPFLILSCCFRGAGHDEYITCVAYSHQEELLVSYNDELIYLFSKSMSMGSGPPKTTTEDDDKLLPPAEDNMNNDSNNHDISPHDAEGSSETDAAKPQVYEGHRNHHTVKGVNFFGPNTEYVVSGSDCGRIFIWRKKGGKLVALMKGDDKVVNCLESHPSATVLATSGIDDTVKVWAPVSDRILDLPQDADRVCIVYTSSCFFLLMRLNYYSFKFHLFLIVNVLW